MSGGCFGGEEKATAIPKSDNTPVGRVIQPCPKRNFVIVLAGPGKYNPKDPHHDQYWGNYFAASQRLFGAKGINPSTSLLPGECAHWLVYEDAYKKRWSADRSSKIDFLIGESGKYTSGYSARTKEYIGGIDKQHGGGKHKYVAIDSYRDLWEVLFKLPDKSLTRLFYFGHGGPDAFYMRWARVFREGEDNTTIVGDTTEAEAIRRVDLSGYEKWLVKKARPEDGQISKFYACSSAQWASDWNSVTGLKSQGAKSTISFRKIREDPTLRSVETEGNPGWTSF